VTLKTGVLQYLLLLIKLMQPMVWVITEECNWPQTSEWKCRFDDFLKQIYTTFFPKGIYTYFYIFLSSYKYKTHCSLSDAVKLVVSLFTWPSGVLTWCRSSAHQFVLLAGFTPTQLEKPWWTTFHNFSCFYSLTPVWRKQVPGLSPKCACACADLTRLVLLCSPQIDNWLWPCASSPMSTR